MKFFYSFSLKNTPINKKEEILNKDYWKLSTDLVKKHYNEVYLITDLEGEKFLKHLNFTKIYTVLDKVPKFKNKVLWSLSKIYAYRFIAKNFNSFCHIDHDVFLWKPIPKFLIESSVFLQSYDVPLWNKNKKSGVYNVHGFYDIKNILYPVSRKIPNVWENHIIKPNLNINLYNMGLFGANNSEIILNYTKFVIDMVRNPDYQNVWEFYLDYHNVAVFLEQLNLGVFFYINNITPNLYFNSYTNGRFESPLEYTHLMVHKQRNDIKNIINNIVNKDPYDLSPKVIFK